jgi:hypothetical protein
MMNDFITDKIERIIFVFLGDGAFELILVKRSWYLDFLRFLHQVASDGRSIEELSNVERYRATEVVIHPIFSQEKELGNWACDGELFEANEIRVCAHHHALNLFASGIHLDQVKKINKEESKFSNAPIMKGFYWARRSIFRPLIDIIIASPFRIFVFLSFLVLFIFFLCYFYFLS